MDDRLMVSGKLKRSMIILSDINLKSLTWWTAKHNAYSSRGAIELLNIGHGFLPNLPLCLDVGPQAKVKSGVKEKIYAKLPASVRANFYYWYHYCFRFGFLDSRAGYFFHSLQPIWYRTLVDTKFSEVENLIRTRGIPLPEAIQILSGIKITVSSETAPETLPLPRTCFVFLFRLRDS